MRFCFDEEAFHRNRSQAKGPTIVPIDQQILAMEGAPSVCPFWRSVERFLENGFGFCILRDGVVAAYILTASTAEGKAEVQIETKEEYRGKGYASALADMYIRHCLAIGVTPKWDCLADNSLSRHIAEKSGFTPVEEYPLGILHKYE